MAKLTIDLDTLPDDVAAYLRWRAGVSGGKAEIVNAIIEGLRLLDAQESAECEAAPEAAGA